MTTADDTMPYQWPVRPPIRITRCKLTITNVGRLFVDRCFIVVLYCSYHVLSLLQVRKLPNSYLQFQCHWH